MGKALKTYLDPKGKRTATSIKNIDFTRWLEYFADGILDELLRLRKLLPAQLEPQPRLEKHHQQILGYIDEHGSITQREYAAISSRSLASRKLDFEKLVDLEMIEAEGVGRGTYYVVKALYIAQCE